MDSSHISERIRARIGKMSSGAKAIAEFAIERPEDVAMLPAARVAERVGVSESTVTRFAVLLGYDGYPAFRRDLQNEVRRHLAPPQRLELGQTRRTGEATLVHGVFEQDIENILRTERNLTAKHIETCCEMISSARHVYVMGLRASFGLAHSLYFQLHQFLGNVTLVDLSRGEAFEKMRGMSVQDLFICFSFPRHTALAVSAVKYAKSSLGAKCIAITDGPLSPIAGDADLLLTVHTSVLDISTSLVGGFSLINGICSEVLLRNRKRAAENLRVVEEELKAADMHVS